MRLCIPKTRQDRLSGVATLILSSVARTPCPRFVLLLALMEFASPRHCLGQSSSKN